MAPPLRRAIRWSAPRVRCYFENVPADRSEDDAAILGRFGIEPDPVIEEYKKDVDRTLLRENLRRSPDERWRIILTAYRLAEEMRRAGAHGRGG